MATKKDNLPLTLDQDNDSTGTITYANEVIAIIAGVAANEVEGVAGMCSGGGITDVFGRNKNITRGVKVELGTEEAAVDIYLIIEYGTPIQTVASNVQENVRKAIESMTGLHVVRVMVETDARAASDTDAQPVADAPIPTAAAPLAEGIEEPIFRHVEEVASYAVSDGEQPDGSRETEVQPDAVPDAPANEQEEDESAPDAPARREATAVESVEGEENA